MADSVLIKEQFFEVTEPPRHMTWEEWLAWVPDSRITEWVDGEVWELSPISRTHDAISRWLIAVLGIFLRKTNVGDLAAAPTVLRFQKVRRGREPDLMFVSKENAHRLTQSYIDGPADVVWEIVSPESRIRDWHDKYREYETEGVREYWVIDPEERRIEAYRLGEDGRYAATPVVDGKLTSSVIPGFYLKPEWLWSDPLPMELDILRELGIL